jgi:hypothetical protein
MEQGKNKCYLFTITFLSLMSKSIRLTDHCIRITINIQLQFLKQLKSVKAWDTHTDINSSNKKMLNLFFKKNLQNPLNNGLKLAF